MRIVSQEHGSKRRTCALTGRSADDEGFLDTNRILAGWDQEVFLSVTAIKEAARLIGWTSPEEVEEMKAALARMGNELQALDERCQKLQTISDLEAEVREVAV